MDCSHLLLLLFPLVTSLDVYSPSQQEFEALLTLSKGGLLDLNEIELDDTIDVSAVEPDDLARLLASCKEGFELSGVRLTQPQWKALVEKAYKGDEWAPKYLSLEDFSTMNQTMGVTGGYTAGVSQLSRDLGELIKNTEMVYISDLALDTLSGWPARLSRTMDHKYKCRWLEIWYTGNRFVAGLHDSQGRWTISISAAGSRSG